MPSPALSRRLALSAVALVAVPAEAQRMDYDALEQAVGEPVTTSVTGKPQRQSETPASTIIITRDEIARSPAIDVPGLLKTYAGIDVNRWTAGQSDVAVRGGVQTYNPRLLVLVNGRQVYLDHYGMTDWNLLGIQIEEIRQIELVRGPAGALFGFNAASGVVNIVTDDPLAKARGSLIVEGGNHDYRRIAGTLSLPVGTAVGIRLSGGHMRQSERRVPADQYQPVRDDAVIRDDLSATVNAVVDPQTQVSITGGVACNHQLEILVTQISSKQRYRTGNLGLRVDHDTPWGSVTGHVYNNWLGAHYGNGADDPGSVPIAALQTFSLTARTFVAQASALFRLGDADTARAGVEYRDNRLDSAITFSRITRYSVVSANAMADIHLAEPLALNVAGRIDRLSLGQAGTVALLTADVASSFDRTLTSESFNAGLTYLPGGGHSLRVNGGRAVQAPSLVVFGMNLPLQFDGIPFPVIVAGDPGIKPVEVWSSEVAYDYRLSAALELKFNAFFTRTNDAIAYPGDYPTFEPRTQPTPLVVTRVTNIDSFRTYGLEASARGGIGRAVTWRANYTFTETDEAAQDISSGIAYALLPEEATARHKANLVLDYGDRRWSGSMVARYTSATRQISTGADRILKLFDVPAALALDAKIALQMTPWLRGWVTGENLTHAAGAAGSPFPADTRLRTGVELSL